MKPDRATLIERAGKHFAETCRLEHELAEARVQIVALAARHEKALVEGAARLAERDEARAQIAAKDAALDALDEAHQITQQNLWQDITELRASLAGNEQEHQDFRLQNDAEWRAKLDHLKAQIAAKDAALRELAAILKRDDDNNAMMMIIADNALAAPARGTK